MSHEIRTPLNAIIGFLDLTLMSELTEQQRQNLDVVKSRSQDLLAIINDVLDLSRVESGKASIDLAEVDLAKIINDLVLTFKPQWAPKGLHLEWFISPVIPKTILCDTIKLKQILNNLINNAIKFSDTGTITITVSDFLPKESGKETEEDKYYFAVSDMGIGIPEEKMETIFKPFVQADCSTERIYGGTGLGLTISKRLVKLLGGDIWVKSTPGKGTTFYFSLSTKLIDMI
jgi:signal transduction histidine kinase